MKNLLLILVLVSFVFSSSYGQKRIAFLFDPTNPQTDLQVGTIAALQGAGYTVDVSYTPFDFTVLGGYDLIIVGRGVSSSDFVPADWDLVAKPVLCLSPFAARDAKLDLIQGAVATPGDLTTIDKTLITNAVPQKNADGTLDVVFNGVTTGAAFPMYTWGYCFLDYQLSDWTLDKNTGTPLVILAPDATMDGSPGAVIMARWKPNTECYAGAGVHVGWRSWLCLGTDDDAGTSFNLDNYTPTSLKLVLNEVAFLLNPLTGVKDMTNESQLKVYPSPSTDGKFNIEMKSSNSKVANVKIYTVTGMQVYNKTFESTGNISVNSGLTKGMYLMQVNADGNKSSQKIVIE